MLSLVLISAALASWFTETNSDTCGLSATDDFKLEASITAAGITVTPTFTATLTPASDYQWKATPSKGGSDLPGVISTTAAAAPTSGAPVVITSLASADVQKIADADKIKVGLYKADTLCEGSKSGNTNTVELTLVVPKANDVQTVIAVAADGKITAGFELSGPLGVTALEAAAGSLVVGTKSYPVKLAVASTNKFKVEFPYADLADTDHGAYGCILGADATKSAFGFKFALPQAPTLGAPLHVDLLTATMSYSGTDVKLQVQKSAGALTEKTPENTKVTVDFAEIADPGAFVFSKANTGGVLSLPILVCLPKLTTQPTLVKAATATPQPAPLLSVGWETAFPAATNKVTVNGATAALEMDLEATNKKSATVDSTKVIAATSATLVFTPLAYAAGQQALLVPAPLSAATITLTKGTVANNKVTVTAKLTAGYYLAKPEGLVLYEKDVTTYTGAKFAAFVYSATAADTATAEVDLTGIDAAKTYLVYPCAKFTEGPASAPTKATAAEPFVVAAPGGTDAGFSVVASSLVALVALLFALF